MTCIRFLDDDVYRGWERFTRISRAKFIRKKGNEVTSLRPVPVSYWRYKGLNYQKGGVIIETTSEVKSDIRRGEVCLEGYKPKYVSKPVFCGRGEINIITEAIRVGHGTNYVNIWS